MIRHYLNFISSNHGRIEIDEPIGFDGVDFGLIQDKDRFGRDVAFAGGTTKIRLEHLANHCFDIMLFNLDKTGFESVVKYEIDFDENTKVIGDVDFLTANTDRFTYFEFSVVEENIRASLKINAETKVNLFSDKDINGNPIQPCEQYDVFQKALPLTQYSEWNTAIPTTVIGAIASKTFDDLPVLNTSLGVNYSFAQIKYDIEDSLSFISPATALNPLGIPNVESFTYLEAKEQIVDLKIDLKDIDIDVTWSTDFEEDKKQYVSKLYGYSRLVIRWGESLDTSQYVAFGLVKFDDFDTVNYSFESNYSHFISNLPRGHRVWIYVQNKIDCEWSAEAETVFGARIVNKFNNMVVQMTATSIAFNTVVPMVRLIDAIKYTVKSISGLEVVAPRFDAGGEYYNQYITTTQRMRRLDKPFNVTFKQICEDWLREPLADYCLRSDGKVFFGFYKDFHRDEMIGSYEQAVIKSFEQNYNERYTAGLLNLKFKSFAAQKEVQQGNTNTTLHAESQWRNGNKRTPKSIDISIGWIRDALLKEQERRKAYDLSDSTASQDDDKIFVDDVVEITETSRKQTETAFLQHQVNGEFFLLKNNNTFSWIQLGIGIGRPFTINSGDNAGTYVVSSVENTTLTLLNSPAAENILGENTTFTYFVNDTVLLKNRTNEGFTSIDNIAGGDNFSNLRFTPKRLIKDYHNRFLATTIRYTPTLPFKNTEYKNNPAASTTYLVNGEPFTLVEGADFIPTNPILEPFSDDFTFLMTLEEALDLRDKARDNNGYILTWTGDGLPVRGYPEKITAVFDSAGQNTPEDFMMRVDCTLNIKYEPFYMSIFGIGDGLIIINGEEIAASSFEFFIDEYEKLLIFGGTGKQLFNPVPFDRVRVNDSEAAKSVTELAQWLNYLKPE